MREATFTDEYGRMFLVRVPDDAPDSHLVFGIRVGPPELELGLPMEVAVRLHNELYHRRLYTLHDVRRRMVDVKAALAAAYGVDAVRVVSAYQVYEAATPNGVVS